MTTHHTHSQAIEIAIDAHASRLLRQHTPPEAFVDFSSLGPYVTECLRKSIRESSPGGGGLLNGSNSRGVGNAADKTFDEDANNDLIELLEGQCQMTRDTAILVIANIDRAVRTGDVLVAGDDNNSTNNNNGVDGNIIGGGGVVLGGMNNVGSEDMSCGSDTMRRTRSKSLGSEPLAYDVNFLGKILQDAMVMPAVNDASASSEVDFSATFATATNDISVSDEYNPVMASQSTAEEEVSIGILKPPNSFDISSPSISFSMDNNTIKSRNKQRSVTFDETQSSSSFLWYDTTASSAAVGPAVKDDDEHFNPLGGILDVLDLEEDGGKQLLQQPHFSVMESILETSFATVDSSKSDSHNEKENETIMAPTHSDLLAPGGVSSNALLLPQCQMKRGPGENVSDDKNETSPPLPPTSSSTPPSSDFPTLGEASEAKSQTQKQGKGRKSKKKKEANDLAAALFRPSRSRSNSLLDNSNQRPRALSLASSSMLRPSSADVTYQAPGSGNGVGMGSLLSQSLENVAGNASISTNNSSENNTASSSPSPMTNTSSTIQSEVNSTTQLLLTLNSHLGTEAATLASQLTDGDLNLAQYLIEAARSDSSSDARCTVATNTNRRTRICRHELRGTCYRADCPYSHDLGGVTCLFWLRGRCRGENCRFMHGFAESLLDGISEEYLKEKREQEARKKEEEAKKIRTGNLLQHNQNQWSSAPADKNLPRSLPTQGFLFLSSSQGGNDASMTTVWR